MRLQVWFTGALDAFPMNATNTSKNHGLNYYVAVHYGVPHKKGVSLVT